MKVALTIAGSDSGGGAGIQADLRTFAARGVFGTTAITCLTAQNPDAVTDVNPVDPAFLREQMLQVDRFFSLAAVKTGMLFSAELIHEVAIFLKDRPTLPAVVDPVMIATSGAALLKPDAVRALRDDLFPRATLITPNLDEAAVLLEHSPGSEADMANAARQLVKLFGRPVLLKGGHLSADAVIDILAFPDGTLQTFEDSRIFDVDTHGSGCTLAAAIAADLARGATLLDAVSAARSYLRRALGQAIQLGGRRFINHNV